MGKHLVFSERVKLEFFINERICLSANELARLLDKSRSTIYYELKTNSVDLVSTNEAFLGNRKYICPKLSKFPFVCNGCPKSNKKCIHKTKIYDAYKAQEKANRNLIDSRVDTERRKHTIKVLNKSVCGLIKDGVSIDVARNAVNNCPYSESTIRRYIEKGLVDAKRIDLPRAVRFRVKKEYKYKTPKLSIGALNGRTYDDYKEYINKHPNAKIVEVDSIIGKVNDKLALFTIYFKSNKFQLGILYNRKHSNINDILVNLYILGRKYNFNMFDVVLADNGSEFKTLYEIEDQIFTKVFYCDPYASYQKGECEKNHGFFRRIVFKGKSLNTFTQEEINEIFSHINSYPRASLNKSSPYDLFAQEYNSIILDELEIIKIPVSKIRLKQYIKTK